MRRLLAIVFVAGLIPVSLLAQETPAQREARRESQRIDAADRARREQQLQRWYVVGERFAPIDAQHERSRARLFLQERARAHESLFILADQLEQLYLLDPATSRPDVGMTADLAVEAVDNVRAFVQWGIDRPSDSREETAPRHYQEGTERLVQLFRDLMPPMEILLAGQTLDLEMHDRALTILARMDSLLDTLPATSPP